MTKLTPKQAAFVREYLVDLNATQAAIRAGYSPKTAYRTGADNLKKPQIARELQEAMEKRSKRTEITADRVLEELGKLAFSNMLDYMQVTEDGYAVVDLSTLTREQSAALTELQVDEYVEGRGDLAREVKKVRVKVADKKSALELLGKHLNLWTDRVDITSKGEALTSVINVYTVSLPANGRDEAS